MKKRKRKKNGAGSAVVGFILGSIFPPLGLGSAFAGYRPGTFWSGASWGGGIAVGLYAIGATVRAVSSKSLTGTKPKALGDPIVVGDVVTALIPDQQTPAGVAANVQRVIVTAVDPTGQIISGAIADTTHAGASFQGHIVVFPRANISARG